MTTTLARWTSWLVPSPKRPRKRGDAAALEWAFRRLREVPGDGPPPREDLEALVKAWGNRAWTAKPDYLAAVWQEAQRANGPILECGCGLTTLVLALKATVPVVSLEHVPEWAERVHLALRKLGLPPTRSLVAPLRDHGAFHWYAPPLDELPKSFALVVCDGPPGGTRGGRQGLVPVLGDRLAPGAVLLLDDAHRADERALAQRWADELGAALDYSSPDPSTLRGKSFARLVLPGAPTDF